MSFTVDKLEKNMVKLTIEVDAEEFAKGWLLFRDRHAGMGQKILRR